MSTQSLNNLGDVASSYSHTHDLAQRLEMSMERCSSSPTCLRAYAYAFRTALCHRSYQASHRLVVFHEHVRQGLRAYSSNTPTMELYTRYEGVLKNTRAAPMRMSMFCAEELEAMACYTLLTRCGASYHPSLYKSWIFGSS